MIFNVAKRLWGLPQGLKPIGKVTFLLAIVICSAIYGQTTPRVYACHFIEDSINIDGVADEKAWQQVSYTDEFIDIEGKKQPKYSTKMKMLWDTTHIYFYAEMKEPHVWGYLKQHDTIVYYDNDFELFIDPDGDTHNYYELEFNALNTLWDLFLTKPYRVANTVLNDWEAKGIKSAVHIDGTLNNPNDVDKGWSLEVALPLHVFKTSYFETTDLEDTFWRMNFSRVNWQHEIQNGKYTKKKDDKGNKLPEYNWVWSPQGVINMHQPETWGYVYFTKKENPTFTIPQDEYVKAYLYEVYRDVIKEKAKQKTVQWESAHGELFAKPKKILEKSVVAQMENHMTGFNIWASSPFSNTTWMLDQDGRLTKK